MSLTRIVAYQVNPDGHWDPVAFSKHDLKARQVYILVDEHRREIWIWIGQGADVKIRFISSTAATEIRRLYGLKYRVKTVDQGQESQIFLDCINSIPSKGLGPEASESKFTPQEEKETVFLSSKKVTPKRTTTKRKTTRKTTKAKTIKTARKKPTKAKTTKTTKVKPTEIKKTTSKTRKSSSTVIKSLDKYLPQDTSVITTPPCPECEVGHLLPYSEILEQEERDPIILPFSKWICSKCKFSPPQ